MTDKLPASGMDGPDGQMIGTPVADRVGPGGTSAQIAFASSGVWTETCAHLHPILGRRGVAAIYRRSLLLNRATHAWLASLPDTPDAIDIQALASALSARPPQQALAASDDLLRTFHQLLTTLIGASLTDRLLRSVWTPPSGAPPDQDTSP